MRNQLVARLAQLDPQARLATLMRGRVPGLVTVLCFCVVLLFGSFRASDRYYEQRLVPADTSYYLMSAALIVSAQNDFGIGQLLRDPAPFHSSDDGTGVYVLQTLQAWYLRSILPLRPAMGVVLNGTWFVAMAVAVYSLLWSRIGRSSISAIATIAFLVANPFLPSVLYGITSLDPNLVGFMLGTSTLCCTVLSDRFQRLIPSLLAGFFLGALCLGRIYTLGVVVPAMLPYVVSCFWRRPRSELWVSLRNGVLALCMTFAVCGWFLWQHWQILLKYPTQYGSAGVVNSSTLSESLWGWLQFPRSLFAQNVTLVCVLSWPLAASFFGPARSWKRFNWSALWAVVAPLLVLAKMGTTFQPYGTLVLFGLFVLLLFPFERPDPALLYRGRFAAALWLACAFNCWSFFRELRAAHDAPSNDKQTTVAALKSVRKDAERSGRRQIKLGLVHWGTLHDAAMIDALVFDLGLRVATPGFQPKRGSKTPLVVEPLATDPWAWDPKVTGAAATTPEAWANRMIEEADYVIVLSGDRRQERRRSYWPLWMEASDRIRASPVFRRLGSPFNVPSDGALELLARRVPRSE